MSKKKAPTAARSTRQRIPAPAPAPPEGRAARRRAAHGEAPASSRSTTFRVRATRTGYIGEERKREGDVFDVTEKQFSDKWMEPVDRHTRLKTTGPQEYLRREHDRIIQERNPAKGTPLVGVGSDDVAGRSPISD